MRRVTGLILAAIVLFSAYWGVAAYLGGFAGAARLDALPQVEGQMSRISGYPLRFETEIRALRWQSRTGEVVWQADPVRLGASSLRPWHLTARFPQEQTLLLDGQSQILSNRDMQGEVIFLRDLTLGNATLAIEGAELSLAPGDVAVDVLTVGLSHAERTQYELDLEMRALTLPLPVLALIDPEQHLPATLGHIRARGSLHFAAALDPRRPAPALKSILLDDLRAGWGPLDIGLAGEVTRSPKGLLDGSLRLSLSDWQVLHRMLVATGVLSPDAAFMAGMFLASQAAPGTAQVTLPLNLSGSVLAIGPFPLAQLPPL